ncbi:MAG: site-2 protease family protein [Candidatus Moranbacteria bacterium]|nr:site-2 protease family protein [Candidatus Moranbacteria bacterium]
MPDLILLIIILIMSAVVHEVSHGFAAFWLGDPTAKYMGRLTLNPLNHLDPWGSFLMPALLLLLSGGRFFFASAKPVPYNPYNLRNQKYGPAIVGAAGPMSNIIIALVFGIFLRIFMMAGLVPASDAITLVGNIFTGANLVGSGMSVIAIIFTMIIYVNILLAIFNLIPIPPLDGSKLLFAILPMREETKIRLEQYGLIFVIPLVILLSEPIFTVISWIELIFFRVVLGV